jgi:plasmid stability protein
VMERLTARAIRKGRSTETTVAEIIENAAEEPDGEERPSLPASTSCHASG